MRAILFGLLVAMGLVGAAQADIPRRQVHAPMPEASEGLASFYCCYFHGRTMANGRRFDQDGRSAAHKSWPFGTRLEVLNLANGFREVVVIEDRGPYVHGRFLDVSRGTARRLGFESAGLARVRVRVVR